MDKTFDNLENGFKSIIPGLLKTIKGLFFLIGESFIELFNLFKQKIHQAKTRMDYSSIVLASVIILGFLTYGLFGLRQDFDHWRHKDYYEKTLQNGYITEIEDFFRKNNEMFLARDCDFFRKVGADEAMYDKRGNEEYPEKNYPHFCENFYQVQEKWWLPIKIGPLEKTGNRYRSKGEMVVVTKNQNEPYFIQVMYFELRKELNRDLWHFNGDKNGPRNIETKTRN